MNTDYLWDKAGREVQAALNDKTITEITVNADGQLWAQHEQRGGIVIGKLSLRAVTAFVHAVASFEKKFLNDKTPYLDGVLPFNGERINIVMPPVTERPVFTIRKKAQRIYTLADYLQAGIVTLNQVQLLKQALHERKNILVSGGPASGKTTFTNALLHGLIGVAPKGENVLLIQQEDELQCNLLNQKSFYTTPNMSMNDLQWLAMRNSPKRIIVGEVRDGAALALLKLWNNGCSGGIATIHANHAGSVLQRVLDLCQEVIINPPFALVSEAIDIIVHINADSTHPAKRQVTDIVAVNGFNRNDNTFDLVKLDKGDETCVA